MCGICGIVASRPDVPVDRELLERMTGLLRHRGPDGAGHYVGAGVALGMRRLSIVDLETGDQPIANEDGSIQLVCNGEIYNAPELQKELEARGHRFRGHSDVEVIVHLYEESGADCVHRLRGMFALALFDARQHALLLARDRLGIKPLCYALDPDGTLIFGSEAKAILLTERVERSLDPLGLADVLYFGGPLFGRTMFRGVRQLEPGHRLLYRGGRLTRERYWDLDPSSSPAQALPRTEAEWIEAVRAKLVETVQIHLRADVPVACWLSPGLDSSAVASLASRALSSPLTTFSLGFDDPRYDELRHHRTLDAYEEYGLRGVRVAFPDSVLDRYPLMIWHKEQPLAVQFPYHVLAQETTSRFKVVLTGQGSDEIFGGYFWYTIDRRWRRLYGLPAPLRRLLGRALPRSRHVDRTALRLPPEMRPSRYAGLMWASGWPELRAVLAPELAHAVETSMVSDEGFQAPRDFERWNRFHQLQYVEAKTRLASFINHGMDTASMAHSVEPRVPFLDHEFVELCMHVPRRLREHPSEKYVLRKAMEPFLPAEIVWREKRGLSSPGARWTPERGKPPGFVDELLSDEALAQKGYFNPSAVAELRRRREGHGLAGTLSQVLGLQLWDELFVQGCRSGREGPVL